MKYYNSKYMLELSVKQQSWNIMKIKNIRKYLDREMCEFLIHSMVISHIDYATGLIGRSD